MASSHKVLPFLLSSARASFGDSGKVRLQKGVEGVGVWSQIGEAIQVCFWTYAYLVETDEGVVLAALLCCGCRIPGLVVFLYQGIVCCMYRIPGLMVSV